MEDESRLLMSDVLKDALDEENAPDELKSLARNYTMVVLGRRANGVENPLVGTLEGFMCQGTDLEVETKIDLTEALSLLSAFANKNAPTVDFVELHDGTEVIRFEYDGRFTINGIRLGMIDYKRRLGIVLLNLKQVA